MGLTTSE